MEVERDGVMDEGHSGHFSGRLLPVCLSRELKFNVWPLVSGQ
jgi:hypothetical protein